jgi:hypothetical protein
MANVGIIRLGQITAIAMLLCMSIASCVDSTSSVPSWDWLGAGPIYSFGDYFSPYYYPLTYPYSGSNVPVYSYNPTPIYANNPVYYGEPYWTMPAPGRYYVNYVLNYPSWVGTHKDLSKVLEIAKTSSVKVYSNGVWQSP